MVVHFSRVSGQWAKWALRFDFQSHLTNALLHLFTQLAIVGNVIIYSSFLCIIRGILLTEVISLKE